jgi:hypothetical protein
MIPNDNFGPILKDLLALYPSLTSLSLREGYRKLAHLAHGWYQRVHRSCSAAAMLENAGFGPEAAPIRRNIIEHTVALEWLATEGDKVMDVMALEHAARTKRIARATKDALWTSVDQAALQAVIDEIDVASRDHTNKEFRNFAKQNTDPGVEATYLAEVGRSHATYQSAIDYSSADLTEYRNTVRPDAEVHTVRAVANDLRAATACLHSMFQTPVWDAELATLDVRSRATHDRDRAERGLPPLDWESA